MESEGVSLGKRLLEWAQNHPEHPAERAPKRAAVLREICRLADDDLALVWFNLSRISDLLNLNKGTVKTHIHSLKKMGTMVSIHSGKKLFREEESRGTRRGMNHYVILADGITPSLWNEFVYIETREIPSTPDDPGFVYRRIVVHDLPGGFFTTSVAELPMLMEQQSEHLRQWSQDRERFQKKQ